MSSSTKLLHFSDFFVMQFVIPPSVKTQNLPQADRRRANVVKRENKVRHHNPSLHPQGTWRFISACLRHLYNRSVIHLSQTSTKKKDISRVSIGFVTAGVSVKALRHFPCTPLRLDHSARRVCSPSISAGAYSPVSSSLSLTLFHSLAFTSSDWSLFLPGFSSRTPLPLAPLIAACCTADRRATSCALGPFYCFVSLPLSLTLSLPQPPFFLTLFSTPVL